MAVIVSSEPRRVPDPPGEHPRDLHPASPPMAGPDVLALQQRLTALGYAPGRLDGVYGSATIAALRSFQRECALAADGVVGPATRHALMARGSVNGPVGLRRRPSKLGLLALEEA